MCMERGDYRDSRMGKGVGVGHVIRFWICSESELSRMDWIGPGEGEREREREKERATS